jgi:flavin reductase
VPAGGWTTAARRYPRTVTLVAAGAGDTAHVITATTFGVVCVDPPLVQVIVAARGLMRALIEGGAGFAVSLLSADHEAVARRCARPGRRPGWASLPTGPWEAAPGSGAPVLHGAPAWLDCHLHSIVGLAGQALVVGSVAHAGTGSDAAPLLRVDGAYRPLHAGGPPAPGEEVTRP